MPQDFQVILCNTKFDRLDTVILKMINYVILDKPIYIINGMCDGSDVTKCTFMQGCHIHFPRS